MLVVVVCGCVGQTGETRNPFLTATETFGTSVVTTEEQQGTSGAATEAEFRQVLQVTLANNHQTAELNTSFVAWVSPSSIRSGAQQDALLSGGYVQLDREVRLGTAFTLVPGTFVYNGPGVAGATAVRLPPTGANPDDAIDTTLATLRQFEIITPDVILLFSQPPVSCDSVAFFFTVDGDPLTSEGVSGVSDLFAGANSPRGGLKTLAQVDVYQCDPFRPGLFLRLGGGALPANEFFEGQDIRIDFSPQATADGFFAVVTKTAP